VKFGGKQRNQLAEISDYIGKRREIEQRNLVPVGQHSLAHRQVLSEPTGNKNHFSGLALNSAVLFV
jgi:hypothetical protein